ncbi:hypothetical protein Tco_0041003 [Tanacetum coccineum]
MSSTSSTVTYTSVDTDSEPGRAFWPADEELSDRGSPRVIVYGYDGLPIQPVAPPSQDYIPGPEDPHAYDPDYVPEPIYPEYVAYSDSEEDQEEDSEEEHADYPADGGDDDDDDTDDEDEEPFEEEEEHLALADPSDIPAVDPVPSAEDTEALEADEPVPTPPSPQHIMNALLVFLAAPHFHHRPLPRLPHLYGSPNHVRAPPGFRATMGRLRASSPLPSPVPASLPLPSPPLPPLPSSLLPPLPDLLFIPPVDRREDIPEAKLPPRKRVDYGFVGTLDAEAKRQRDEAVGYGIRDTWDTHDIYVVIEDTQDRQTQIHQTVEALVDDRQYHYKTTRLLDQEALVSREA